MLDLISSLGDWAPALAGQRFAVATIVAASGSVPRPVGTSMLVSESGAVLGSLSGGCVDGAVVGLALESMDDGGTRCGTFGYSAADAFAAGLTCGGELEIHIEPFGPAETDGDQSLQGLRQLASSAAAGPVAVIRRVDALGRGLTVVTDPATFAVAGSAEISRLLGQDPSANGTPVLLAAAAAQLEPLLRGGRTGLVRLAPADGCRTASSREAPGHRPGSTGEPVTLLVESRLAPPRMLVFGANDFSAALLPAARMLGYYVTLVDARPAFASQSRFSTADEVVTDWPHRYLAAEAEAGRLDHRAVLCVLTHDPKFDIPLLETALALDVAYVGAMGSRRSHLQRVDDLLDAGVRPERIALLHSPIGLDIGAVTPAEVAISITAEVIAARNALASHGPLRDTSGPVHQQPVQQQPAAGPATIRAGHQEIAWT
jgi:xanthine dehydrogenase accessory factor